ncbi:MAG: cysteine--tRNA ligase [Bacilli bacterium]|jgi:cysteinyl-tRNA synthetase
MKIVLYNSLTKQKENFIPLKKGHVSMYVCGPTVYDYVHVGNMRPVVVFDTLRRFFEHVGYKVTYVSNYTDVDDRIIEKAISTSKSEKEISEFYIEAFKESATKINALNPSFMPKATEHIASMIEFIKVLINKDAAYANDGEVFFRVGKVPTYGELSNVTQDELQVGARIDANPKKEHPHDFLLWKKTDVGIRWDSPWGEGRPGWHTECVVMINDIFGEPLIDIHGGGFDLKFPHHENEIAQARAYADKGLANYWLHNGFINLNNQKMAKSTGNIVTARDFIEQYGGTLLRLLLLSTHYRSPVNLSADIIENTNNEVERLKRTKQALVRHFALYPLVLKDDSLLTKFNEELADDLNTPNALSELYALVKDINILLRTPLKEPQKLAKLAYAFDEMLNILGLDLGIKKLDKKDAELLKEYENARKNKDFARSDALREVLQKKGIF